MPFVRIASSSIAKDSFYAEASNFGWYAILLHNPFHPSHPFYFIFFSCFHSYESIHLYQSCSYQNSQGAGCPWVRRSMTNFLVFRNEKSGSPSETVEKTRGSPHYDHMWSVRMFDVYQIFVSWHIWIDSFSKQFEYINDGNIYYGASTIEANVTKSFEYLKRFVMKRLETNIDFRQKWKRRMFDVVKWTVSMIIKRTHCTQLKNEQMRYWCIQLSVFDFPCEEFKTSTRTK